MKVTGGKPYRSLSPDAGLKEVGRNIFEINHEVIKSFRMKGLVSSVDPAFNPEFLCLGSVRGLKKLPHPSCRELGCLKIEHFCIDQLLHWNIAVI